jgi:CspA family cold shock protein
MNLFSQLLVGLISAGAATAAILQFHLSGPLHLGITLAIACCISPLLNALISRSPGSSYDDDSYDHSGDYSDDHSDNHSDEDREEGEVKWFNVSKGFGFIRRDNGEEIFVHFRSIRSKNPGRRGLRDGQRVTYVVVESDKGPQAEAVEEI